MELRSLAAKNRSSSITASLHSTSSNVGELELLLARLGNIGTDLLPLTLGVKRELQFSVNDLLKRHKKVSLGLKSKKYATTKQSRRRISSVDYRSSLLKNNSTNRKKRRIEK